MWYARVIRDPSFLVLAHETIGQIGGKMKSLTTPSVWP